jgi:hypothetical protein
VIRTVALSSTIWRNKTQKQQTPLESGAGISAEAGETVRGCSELPPIQPLRQVKTLFSLMRLLVPISAPRAGCCAARTESLCLNFGRYWRETVPPCPALMAKKPMRPGRYGRRARRRRSDSSPCRKRPRRGYGTGHGILTGRRGATAVTGAPSVMPPFRCSTR